MICAAELRGPRADDLVEFVLVLAAPDVVDVARVVGELWLFHGGGQPTEDGVLVGRDDHPASVGTLVDVRRRDALSRVPDGPPDHTAHVVVGDRGLLDGQAASMSEVSTTCPRPVMVRRYSAASAPWAGEHPS